MIFHHRRRVGKVLGPSPDIWSLLPTSCVQFCLNCRKPQGDTRVIGWGGPREVDPPMWTRGNHHSCCVQTFLKCGYFKVSHDPPYNLTHCSICLVNSRVSQSEPGGLTPQCVTGDSEGRVGFVSIFPRKRF